MSWAPNAEECYICKSFLANGHTTLTTECGHTFHRRCAKKRLEKKQKGDCKTCRKPAALAKALGRHDESYHELRQEKSSTSLPLKSWYCESCSMENVRSTKGCDSCGQLQRSLSKNPRRTAADKSDEDNRDQKHRDTVAHQQDKQDKSRTKLIETRSDGSESQEWKAKTKDAPDYKHEVKTHEDYMEYLPQYSKTIFRADDRRVSKGYLDPSSVRRRHETVVYIIDLPTSMYDDVQLEQRIRHRIEQTTNCKPHRIKCYSLLGIGMMYVDSDEIRNQFINDIENIALNPKEDTVVISFVAKLELVSYVILEDAKDAKDFDFPTSDDISRRWAELFMGETPDICEQLSDPFKSIYKVVSTSLEKLLDATKNPDFQIKGRFARIYANADCSFLEDLPRSVTEDQLRQAIGKEIQQPNISASSIYIHLIRQSSSACILAVNTGRAWSTKSSLVIDGKLISKKNRLSYRLCIYAIPQSLSIKKIVNSEYFVGKILNHKEHGENLVLELSDKTAYDRCLTRGVIRIDNDNRLRVGPYTVLSNPEFAEIDENTWYSTEMSRFKPDIMQFISNPDHEIFRYKWNSTEWIKQFKATVGDGQDEKHACGRRHSPTDVSRHLLRVTVMLNTLATVRQESYVIGNRKVYLSIDKRLQAIIYDHRSKLERAGALPTAITMHQTTRVDVFKEDCLSVYERLLKNGYKPLLLNMANAKSPGGGYRTGDEAQEENLFRRSDYFRSLDIGLDHWLPQRCERFYRSSNCQLEPVTDSSTLYPMHEFGGIYTSDLTVFRQSEDTGYMFMEEPLHGVCSFAMAAYRDPQLDGNMLASTYAIGTRKKIENIFAVAYHHKHDSLVLSAFGCGTFKNPPIHVAKLFNSVIEQYAGFFKLIAFAIVDDHNTGHHLNPEGNYKPFKDILDGFVVQRPLAMNVPHATFGPYQLLSDGASVSDICILEKRLCKHGGLCSDILDHKHGQEFAHPPLCPHVTSTGKCTLTKDIAHMSSFVHLNSCKYGGECRNIDDKKHAEEYQHPLYCSKGGGCVDVSEEHLKQYRHLPLCPEGPNCLERRRHNLSHCADLRHCALNCRYGNHCANFHSQQHLVQFEHPFRTPCPFTPFHCAAHIELMSSQDHSRLKKEIQQHCLDFAHVCPLGRTCKDQSRIHLETSIHVARYLCPDADTCLERVNEDHLNSFTHPAILDIRALCPHADGCYDRRKLDHAMQFRHAAKFEQSGILSYFTLNRGTDFFQNQEEIIKRVTNYIENENWNPLPSGNISLEILNWMRTVQPVHRCDPFIFESILLHGHVMSRQYMDNLKDPVFVANSILQHSRIRRIPALQEKVIYEHAKKYIIGLVQNCFEQNGFVAVMTAGDVTSYVKATNKIETYLASNMKEKEMEAIRSKSMEIASASINLHTKPSGIGFDNDKDLGTDKTVFSILGPHLGHYYGDICIVFKREILHHPDANFTVQAATSFVSGSAYQLRPWLGDPPNDREDRVKLYHGSKLNAAIPGYEYAAALELIAFTSLHFKQNTMNITLDKILERWFEVDSHLTVEGHLPQLIPLSYIDHIYIPQNLYDSLTDDARKAIKANFKYRITLVPHDGEAQQPSRPHGPKPPTQSREKYQEFVVEELRKRFLERAKHLSSVSIRGIAITIASSDFTDPYILPLTISQAYEQYCSSKKHPPPENTYYIYWQVAVGDIMLTLSNQAIETDKTQTSLRCLSCYLAGKCPPSDTSYYEHHSYLNDTPPFKHATLREGNKFAGKSNRFYVGCNMDSFMTFCLEIQRSTNTVTLSHAGPNAIYNHQKISCSFEKSQLDLATMNYVHLTSGSRTVPVRNLIICFEKQKDLHPTYDRGFKKGSSVATVDIKTVSSDVSHDASTPKTDKQDEKKSSGFIDKALHFTFGHESSALTPCRDNVNCLRQHSQRYGPNHNAQYSHPCPYSELCYKTEPHFTHAPHRVSICNHDKKCNLLTDPFHRAQYRHSGLPDFLIPCRYQERCYQNSPEHRMVYSHGEQVYKVKDSSVTSKATLLSAIDGDRDRASPLSQTPCKWGSRCRNIENYQHCREYSHPIADRPKSDDSRAGERHRSLCRYGAACYDRRAHHREQYSHPETKASSDSGSDDSN